MNLYRTSLTRCHYQSTSFTPHVLICGRERGTIENDGKYMRKVMHTITNQKYDIDYRLYLP